MFLTCHGPVIPGRGIITLQSDEIGKIFFRSLIISLSETVKSPVVISLGKIAD